MMKPKRANEFFDENGDATRIHDNTGGIHAHPARHRPDDGHAFLPDPSEGGRAWCADEVVEDLAEGYLAGATTGGADVALDKLDQVSDEEEGGPFLEESASMEYGHSVDDMNPADATREPFPSPNRGI